MAEFAPRMPGDGIRWGVGIATAAALHVAGAAVLLRVQAPPPDAPVMLLELAPAPQTEAAPQESLTETPSEIASPPEPPSDTPPPEMVRAAPPPEIPPPPDPPQPTVQASPEPPAVQLPPPDPLPQPKRPARATSRPAPPRPVHAAVEATPAQVRPAAPPQPAVQPMSADWRARLLAHLNRYKHYPPAAQMRHQQGIATVRLTLMPDGSAQAVVLQSSAGIASLDQEATALIARAQPLPVPSASAGPQVIVVPIQFILR